MNVLLVHQYFDPKLRGANLVVGGAQRAIQQNGHAVLLFGSRTSEDSPGVVGPAGYTRNEFAKATLWQRLRYAVRGIHSFEARDSLRQVLVAKKPDVAIVFKPEYQLTYSVLPELKRFGVPIVQWLVDYRFWCTAGYFFNFSSGVPCYRCAGGAHWNAVRYRCGDGSLPLSIYGAVARLVRHKFLHLEALPDLYVVPTESTKQVLVRETGLPEGRILVIPHPFRHEDFPVAPDNAVGDYIVFAGHLLPEKGIWTLLRAIAMSEGLKAEIYGIDSRGEATRMNEFIVTGGFSDRVKIDTTTRFGPMLLDRLRGARSVVIPSEWPDTSEYSAIESMALGKAVIVTDAGGNAEHVRRAECGLVVKASDPQSLSEAIQTLARDPDLARRMGERGRTYVREQFSEESFTRGIASLLLQAQSYGSSGVR
jgi:glycosyltransferase involved in cell wall biosynthesis